MFGKNNTPFKNGRNNVPTIKQAPAVSFSSGMTSQQKYHSIVQSVQLSLAGRSSQITKGCSMHPKISPKCRKCQAIVQQSKNNQVQMQQKQQSQLTFKLLEQMPQQIKLNNQSPKNHLNQKLQSNIVSSHRYKIYKQLKSVKEVLAQLSSDQIPIQAYRKGTTQDPTEFMICLFRIMQLKPTKPQLIIMMRDNNVNVRALALIYIRMALDFQQIYSFLKTCLEDNKLINAFMTVGQLANKLLSQQGMDQGGIRMPRIPTKIQKAINQKIIQINRNNQINQLPIQKQEPIVQVQRKKQKNSDNQNWEQRCRSRQKNRKKNSSRSSSSSSSSCSSSSSSSRSSSSSSSSNSSKNDSLSSRQKQRKNNQKSKHSQSKIKPQVNSQKDKRQVLRQKLLQPQAGSTSLQALKSKINKSLIQNQTKQQKKKLLLQKYNAKQKMQVEIQEGQHSQQSDSVQKYQFN